MKVLDSTWEEQSRVDLKPELDSNLGLLRMLLRSGVNSDAQFRMLDCRGVRMCALYIEGMADDRKLSEFALRSCEARGIPEGDAPNARALMESVLEIAQCEPESRVQVILSAVACGKTALLVDGCDEAVLMETRGYPSRQVNRTTNESVVIGAQEGFVESLRTNMTLLRRYVPSPRLITERIPVGTQIACNSALVYLDGVADKAVIDAVRQRLMRIDAPCVQGLGAIQEYIEDNPWALLPQLLQTERPDRAASCLTEGQVALLADNSPYALIAPATLFHQLHASDDTFARWQYGSFLRLIRLIGILISAFLPGLYIALADYHMHMLPMSLLSSISEARANVPFPILVEILFMEFSFYLINEAGTRIPQQIGSALGIVGALILGQAAVSASIISPMLIIIVSVTGLGNYAIPNYGFSIGVVICRLFIILCGALLGLYGVCLGGFCVLMGLCGMRSLGFPYLAPMAPHRRHNPDLLLRLPAWTQVRPMFFAARNSWIVKNRREAS